jgi:hypothetical protein
MSTRILETLPLDQLRPWPCNARTHSRKQIRQIAESIRRFGFTNPVLIDAEERILAGHDRVMAARELGMATAPCLRVDHMSLAEKRAYVLADNKLALNAGWDEELLALELKELMAADIDFSIDLTGFSIAEVDQLIEGLAPEEQGDPADDRLPDPAQVPSRCQPGDIWRLGPRRLVCGDALDPAVVRTLMDGEKAEMVFTDPPYNVAIAGNVSGLGKVRHREFAMASGEMTRDEFAAFLSAAFANLTAHSKRELERRANLGTKGPEPLPHPDDVIIDVRTGQVNVKGPMTKEEKVKWDRAYASVEECDREIAEMTAFLKLRKNQRYRRLIEDDIAHEKRIRQIIVNAVGEPNKRNPGGT